MSKGKTDIKFIEISGRTVSQRTIYFENGSIATRGIYGRSLNGWEWNVPVGIEEKYFENGQLEYRLVYNTNGNLDGECDFYNRKGKLVRKRIYSQGKLLQDIDYSDAENT